MATGISILLIHLSNLYKKRLQLDEYAIHLEQNIQKSRELLNALIESALIEWSLYNIRTESEAYITDEKRDICLEWIIKKIIKESTPAILDQLGVGYPVGSQEEYINTIKTVAIPHILKFCLDQNSKSMEDDIPNINIGSLID